MSWFEKLMPTRISTAADQKRNIPEGIWVKCDSCSSVLYRPELERNLHVCPKCGFHRRLGARLRLESFLDTETLKEIAPNIEPMDVLKFRDSKKYRDRISESQKKTGEKDALVVMSGEVHKLPVVAAAFEFAFMGGSMGSVVGEKFVRGVNEAIERKCPFICFTASGGARMQEALFSLMQMAKTSAALGRMADAGLPFVSVMTDPTLGGVSASLAMLGDVNVGEPGALIGFAGPRVIEQTVRETLPEGFQRSEFLLEHGAIDMIIDRRELRPRLASLLSIMLKQGPIKIPDSESPAKAEND